MIQTFPNTAKGEAQAFAVPEPREIEHALEKGQWFWRVRTGDDCAPAPTEKEIAEELTARQLITALARSLKYTDEQIAEVLKAAEKC